MSENKFEFAWNLYKILPKKTEENVFMSPYSVSSVLSMALLGCRENTRLEIKKGLGVEHKSDDLFHGGNLEFVNCLKFKHVVLEIANKLFPEATYTLKEEFKVATIKFYNSQVKSLDFKVNAEKSRQEINNWAKEMTHNKIEELLPYGSINSNVSLVLANAVYFKGNWLDQFNEKFTYEADFYVSENKTGKVKMMSREGKYGYIENQELGIQIVELPYQGKETSMIILVPQARYGLEKLEDNLSPEILSNVTSQFVSQKIILSLPRMKIEYGSNLVQPLRNLGINDIFNPSLANLTGISDLPNLYVSNVSHKAFIEVNEEGTEAAAATAMVATFMMALPSPQVTCDHPFLFLIKHNPTNTILFMGKFAKPQ